MQADNLLPIKLNSLGYFEAPGISVMCFGDDYPECHQGGVTLILNGSRVAANGDVRLDATPGQWQPTARLEARETDTGRQAVVAQLSFPDPARNRTGFNPIVYPELELKYRVTVVPDGGSVRIIVDLCEPLPPAWVGRVGFNLELFPGDYYGKSWILDEACGIFPRQVAGPYGYDEQGQVTSAPLARGTLLSVAPESADAHLCIEAIGTTLALLDGTVRHNNGWFIVRSDLAGNTTTRALEWKVTPYPNVNWKHGPVIQLSQVGYHPQQQKVALIELDARETGSQTAVLMRIAASGRREAVKVATPAAWGHFLRYQYLQFDFTEVRQPGIYCVRYGSTESHIFRIGTDIYAQGVWQPTLEYFLPVQMCHMRVNDRYRVWHGLCHMQDARMAPPHTIHFDGYAQGPGTLTAYQALEPVPGLCTGGWHDAGDYDLRIESQIETVRILARAYEAFQPGYDATSINQELHLVELHRPDGTPDILEQIEHGVLSILGGYKNLGRLYRGIISATLQEYVLLGDAANNTERWVFTEANPARELAAAAGLAAAARVLAEYRPALAHECGQVAQALFAAHSAAEVANIVCAQIEALAELILLTDKTEYKQQLTALLPAILEHIHEVGWLLGRLTGVIDDKNFHAALKQALSSLRIKIREQCAANPFGVPYTPRYWGAGWAMQKFGMRQYYLHRAWPALFEPAYLFNALHFVLGAHPGSNTASFISGVGSKSMTTAYGINRAEHSYIPGGAVPGTALIHPDFPELKDWPYLWQQGEYMIAEGACSFLFLVLAADQLLNEG